MSFSIRSLSFASSITQRYLRQNNDALSKNIQRLSSGYRINTGADGPADLVVSEQLRSRLVGLEQEIQNTERSSSLMATVEGSLGEVQGLLTKMRQLALSAANTGVRSVEMVEADQTGMDSALQAIERALGLANQAGGKLLANIQNTLGLRPGSYLVDPELAGEDQVRQVTGAADTASAETSALALGVSGADAPLFLDSNSLADVETVDRSVLELHNFIGNLTTLEMDALGGVYDGQKVLTLSDLYSGGKASLSSDPVAALKVIEKAASGVAKLRAEIGAIQTGNDAWLDCLKAEYDNTLVTESYIRDTDIAREMTDYTMNQLMVQVGIGLLADHQARAALLLGLLQP